jgi:hypothetical protein
MSTTIAAPPLVRSPRRTLIAAGLAAALAFGTGAAVVDLTSTDHPTTRAATTAPVATAADVQALWNQLSTLPAEQRDAIVTNLNASVRSQLQAIAEGIAATAEHH